MRVVVTGAGGFVGRALVPLLLADQHEVVGIDRSLGGLPGIAGELGDPAVLDRAFAAPCDALIHLATVPGGAAEQDPAAAWAVNIDQSMALLRAAARGGHCPRVLFASSIAVFGDALPAIVDDRTPVAPRLLYGAHKAMLETWIDTLTRRGEIAGLSLRLPGIVARPRAPSGMKSAFMSDLFHAAVTHERMVLPVSPGATLWLLSVSAVAQSLRHGLTAPLCGALNLPALRVTMGELAGTVAAQTGADPGLFAHDPDPAIEAGFGALPPLATPAAEAAGFGHDGTIGALVGSALATLG